jgi:hypothetical protein
VRAVLAPSIWVNSIEDAKNRATAMKPMFLYFTDKDKKELPWQFLYSAGMQNISRREAVFVYIKLSKRPTNEERKLMRQYRVRRFGTAVLADHNGNLLGRAEVKNSSTLLKQVRKARALVEKIEKDITKRIEKGKSALEKGNTLAAKIQFRSVMRKYPTYDASEEAAEFLEKVKKAEQEKKEKAKAKARKKAKPDKKAEPDKKVEAENKAKDGA